MQAQTCCLLLYTRQAHSRRHQQPQLRPRQSALPQLQGCSRHCRRQSRRLRASHTRAMVNLDVSPAFVLGGFLIAAGACLYQIRSSKPYISKDVDVVIGSVAIFSGGILVFQVRRLPFCLNSHVERRRLIFMTSHACWMFRHNPLKRNAAVLHCLRDASHMHCHLCVHRIWECMLC